MIRARVRLALWGIAYRVAERLLGPVHDRTVDIAEAYCDARIVWWRITGTAPEEFRDATQGEWTEERLARLYAAIVDDGSDA